MRVQVALVFLVQSLVSAWTYEDFDDSYRYKAEDDLKVNLLDGVGPFNVRRFEKIVGDNSSGNLDPEDLQVVKEAIQKLLGRSDIPEYVAPTSPTRTPEPLSAARRNSTRSTYTQLLGRLRDYVDRGGMEGEGTQIVAMSSITEPSVNSTIYYDDYDDAALRFRTLRRTRRTRRKTTTRPTRRTKNTLCTDSIEYCATMCFDSEKYRVSCPTTTTPVTSPRMDVSKLLYMLSSLIVDYDTNLTEVMNMTLQRKGYVSCLPAPNITTTTVTTVSATEGLYDYEISNKTGAVISKCFVCGLEVENIPMKAHCSDAFAGDLLPMVPVDAAARGHLAEYRKYCKYMDMMHWFVNGSDSRSIWGRWTGGCAVRWIDLSGVYTQRTCRNRNNPSLGRHFLSKRMARLELALRKVDNGCIISPMASLVPFSRGISLYARFHACVCTGNWCNRAVKDHRAVTLLIMPFIMTLFLTD